MNDPSQTMDRSALTGAYALDAVDDIERAQVERLMDESTEAAAEVASFQETAARLGAAVATTPPVSLRGAVLAEIRSTRQVPPVTGATHNPSEQTRGGAPTTVRWLSVAAACLLAVSVGLGAWVVDVRQEAEQSRTVAEALSTVLQHPDRQVLEADFAGGKATLVVAENRVVLVGNGVQAPPDEHDYQLWLLDEEGVPRPSVTLTATGDGGFFADTTGYQPGEKMAVTIEPEGGSQAPTTDPVFVAG
jgi:anti-sigma-K factor RskA